jgi:hypothetical protein
MGFRGLSRCMEFQPKIQRFARHNVGAAELGLPGY